MAVPDLVGLVNQLFSNVVTVVIFVVILAIPVVGILLMKKYMQKDAWAEIEEVYEKGGNEIKIVPCKYTENRNFLDSHKLDMPLPIEQKPQRFKGKPLYRFYSPEPKIYIPKKQTEEIEIQVEKDGETVLRTIRQMVPEVGFAAKEAFMDSFQAAEEMYSQHGKLMEFALEWGPHIITWIMMFLILWQLSSAVQALASINIPERVIVEGAAEAAKSAGAGGASGVPSLPGG